MRDCVNAGHRSDPCEPWGSAWPPAARRVGSCQFAPSSHQPSYFLSREESGMSMRLDYLLAEISLLGKSARRPSNAASGAHQVRAPRPLYVLRLVTYEAHVIVGGSGNSFRFSDRALITVLTVFALISASFGTPVPQVGWGARDSSVLGGVLADHCYSHGGGVQGFGAARRAPNLPSSPVTSPAVRVRSTAHP